MVSGNTFPFHQGKVVLPGFIHDVFSILQGSFKLVMMFDSIKSPILSLINKTRQGLLCGKDDFTFIVVSDGQGESLVINELLFFCFDKYIPA